MSKSGEQIEAWRLACEQANEWVRAQQRQLKVSREADQQRVRALERDLRRKEKALAEAAALLVLRKEAEPIWGEDEAV